MSEVDDDKSVDSVEMLYRINHLKEKAGGDPNSDISGSIDEDAIKDADKEIDRFCNDCPKMVHEVLVTLLESWESLKDAKDIDKRKEYAHEIFTKSHEIKDISGTCGYILISDFGESLRDYILETKIDQGAHEKIIQAHVDVMSVAYKDDIKDDGGPVAAELRNVLKTAMEKYG